MINGHYCNGVVDPTICCPVAHGETDIRLCTCKVSPEMAKAVEAFLEASYIEDWRQNMNGVWILRKHKPFNLSNPNYVRCRLKRGAGPLKNGKCVMCGEETDWV